MNNESPHKHKFSFEFQYIYFLNGEEYFIYVLAHKDKIFILSLLLAACLVRWKREIENGRSHLFSMVENMENGRGCAEYSTRSHQKPISQFGRNFLLGIYFLGSLFSFSLTNTHSRKIEIFSIILLFYTSFNFYPVTFHSPN